MHRAHTTLAIGLSLLCGAAHAQVAVKGKVVHTMAGEAITDGVVVVTGGRISAVGAEGDVSIPAGHRVLSAAVVTPGLVDAHGTLGLTGIYNHKHDQDQLERSAPIQPELQAIDAYNVHEDLIEWVRGYGITTVHTGHAPGELISGQTMIIKTVGDTVEDAVIVPTAAVAVTLSNKARKGKGKSPGTRSKMMAMLRGELIKAKAYAKKLETAEEEKQPERNLRSDALAKVLAREIPLLVTANKAQDIASALRLAREFQIDIWLDSAAESYLLADEIRKAGVPVIVHPAMARAYGEMKNISFETPAILKKAGIPVAIQSGYESYVPKVRVVLFEAAIAAANGMSFDEALAAITIDAARILRIDDRVGSLEVGKDGDLALYDGDPFEYTSHCVGVIIDGRVVSDAIR